MSRRSFTIFLVLGSFVCTSVVKSWQIEDDHVCQVFGNEVLCQSTTTSIRLPCIRECGRYKENCQSARVYGNDRQCRIQLKTITCDRVEGNIQQWTWNKWSTTSGGQVLSVNYMKKNASTALRVRWSGRIRGGYSSNYGSRFYFTFNGAPCSEPAGIEAVDWTGAGRNYIQHTEFEGLCNNIPAGRIQIGFNVGKLPGISWQPYLGWSLGNCKITAEEVDLGENKGTCPHHTVFNVKQHTFATADTASGIYSASAFSYTKLAPDTSLRVRWFGTLGVKSQSPAPGCLRFYFTFNGEECKAPTPIDGAIAWLTDPIIRTQTTHSIEGICQNLGQGDHAVALNVGQCLFGNLNQMDPDPRVNDVSRIIVEEVRLGKSQFAEQAVLLTCSFESSSICGFTQSTNDDFNWTRRSGGTSSSYTGPSSAYSGSYYMYIETSSP
ncbi:uncharacterized protein LOC106181354, partial [Lingula anatina]|uniref:Uncharacterized protein LOC106181354 n=1 Tax=Lingula anatina TaxID=7574 RepID=A0A1S3KEW2_LINAN